MAVDDDALTPLANEFTDAIEKIRRSGTSQDPQFVRSQRLVDETEFWSKFLSKFSLGAFPIPITLSVRSGGAGLRACVTVMVPDVRDPKNTIPVHAMQELPELEYESDPAKACRRTVWLVQRLIQDVLKHELDEWLRFDGNLLVEPHPELKSVPAR